MCGQHNVMATAEENTDKGLTPSPRTGINIPDPAGNRTRAAELKDRDCTDHATATDPLIYYHHLHESVLPQGRSFTTSGET